MSNPLLDDAGAPVAPPPIGAPVSPPPIGAPVSPPPIGATVPPCVISVDPDSPAHLAGMQVGDEILLINGQSPRDVIEWQLLVDEGELDIELRRSGIELSAEISKTPGHPLGIDVHSAVFDRVRTCDNHCEFCFIYQLPKGMRRSLYLKDDDYRLSFLYGNYTTLTRFTEADFERVVTEGLSPLNVSIHATDPDVRTDMLRNKRGATSLRWLRALLDADIEIHGQIVVCPGLNDGDVLEETLCGVLDEYPELASVCVVPLGVSAHSNEARMRPHTVAEAARVCEIVESWQDRFLDLLGRRTVFASDEYYLRAELPFPASETYEGFPMHEDGIGMARTLELEFTGQVEDPTGVRPGFFASVDGAPADGYRAPRAEAESAKIAESEKTSQVPATPVPVSIGIKRTAPVGILTGELGAQVLAPLVESVGRDDVRIVTVRNDFFGGNTAVAGLMTGADLARTLAEEPEGHRYLLPDVCLSRGMFLDGLTIDDLPRSVEVLSTDGVALRKALRA